MSRQPLDAALAALDGIILGKQRQLRLALACLLARGHLLIEDVPGTGKTTLAQALARVLGLSFARIQFTSDLLPADIVGIAVYDRDQSRFQFHPGPVFHQLLLADEINRSTPKTQSALLEAMAEGQVSTEGETRPLPQPFFVIATQNPNSQYGTFPLPESQLDRFLMRIHLGYPDAEAERRLLTGGNPRQRLAELPYLFSEVQLQALQDSVDRVQATATLIAYVQRLVQHTRQLPECIHGVSPRGALALLQAARAWAFLEGRSHVIPEDVQAVFGPVTAHRLHTTGGEPATTVAQRVLDAVDIL